MVTCNPDAFKSLPSDAAVIPFPSPDTTPPVTKIYLVVPPSDETPATEDAPFQDMQYIHKISKLTFIILILYSNSVKAFAKNNLQIWNFYDILISHQLGTYTIRRNFYQKVPQKEIVHNLFTFRKI